MPLRGEPHGNNQAQGRRHRDEGRSDLEQLLRRSRRRPQDHPHRSRAARLQGLPSLSLRPRSPGDRGPGNARHALKRAMRFPTLTLPKLGVGLAYQAPLAPLLAAAGPELDYVEVVPDILWTDLGRGAEPRYIDDRAGRAALEQASRGRPVVAHGIGLSIGSAGMFD